LILAESVTALASDDFIGTNTVATIESTVVATVMPAVSSNNATLGSTDLDEGTEVARPDTAGH